MEEVKSKLQELSDFKDKLSIFMNLDFIQMTTQAQSLDEFLRRKINDSQV